MSGDSTASDGAAQGGARPLTPVAVAVIERADGRVLIAQRPEGKPYAGWWEFPGGKLEAGESVHAALVREIDEELGLQVRASEPWVTRDFEYPHAHVRLYFRRVRDFTGEARSREGQRFAWLAAHAVDVEPLLPATVPVLAWLRLPAHYAISNVAGLGVDGFLGALDRALGRGLRLLQLREPGLSDEAFAPVFEAVLTRCRQAGAALMVNSIHPEACWQAAGGVHRTGAALAALAARPGLERVFASCHVAADLLRAGSLGLDAAVLGPVQTTASHPGQAPLGWSGFAEQVAATPVPVFALGGLSPGDLDMARAQGAHGVAALRAWWTPQERENGGSSD